MPKNISKAKQGKGNRICEYCKKEYIPIHQYSRFCCRNCYIAYLDRKKKRICPNCGEEFKYKFIAQRFCTKECYYDSNQLKTQSKESYLIKSNMEKKWRKGTKGKSFTNKGMFQKGDERVIGSNNNQWKGGITPLVEKIRKLPEYALWRNSVFKRDKYTCQFCGLTNCQLAAHHRISFSKIIKKNNIKTIEQALYCSELWDIDNGVTLCESECHKIAHKKPKRC